MSRAMLLCLLGLVLLSPIPLAAQPAEQVSPSDAMDLPTGLSQLGAELQRLREIRNVFLRAEKTESLREAAQSYTGRPLSLHVEVVEVTCCEVVVRYDSLGKTQVVFQHQDHPPFGNLRTVYYNGSSGTCRANLLSQPFALRIGTEIDLDVAKRLDKGDSITIRGKLECVVLDIEGWFEPRAIAIVGDWTPVVSTAEAAQ